MLGREQRAAGEKNQQTLQARAEKRPRRGPNKDGAPEHTAPAEYAHAEGVGQGRTIPKRTRTPGQKPPSPHA